MSYEVGMQKTPAGGLVAACANHIAYFFSILKRFPKNADKQ